MRALDGRVGGRNQVGTALISAVKIGPGRTPATNTAATQAGSLVLRDFLQLNNRQMSATGQVRHVQRDPLAALPSHLCRRPGAGRTPWPASPRLEARALGSWRRVKVDLLRSSCLKRVVRSVSVVPLYEETDLMAEGLAIQRHQDAARGPWSGPVGPGLWRG